MEKRVRILLVDDDRDLLQVLQMSLEMNACFKVVTSVNGQEACFKFRNEDFDVIITDLKMPKMDGVEFISAVQKIREVPIVVISASLDAFKFKMKDYKTSEQKNIQIMPKPFHPDELSKKITEITRHTFREPQIENTIKFRAGETVFEEDSRADGVFIVKEGSFSIYKRTSGGQDIRVITINAGEVLGEMAIFNDNIRTKSVKAETDGVLIRIPLDKMRETLNAQPSWMKVMMKTVTQRLSDTTSELAELKAKKGTLSD